MNARFNEEIIKPEVISGCQNSEKKLFHHYKKQRSL